MSRRRHRVIAEPFLVAPAAGARVRTRLIVDDADVEVLVALGSHLGSLAGADLARRCSQGRLDPRAAASSRRERKRSLTGQCSSRWAGAITRTSDDAWALAERNLVAEAASLRARIARIRRRLAGGVGERRGRTRGYGSGAERFAKQRRLQVLQGRLKVVQARLEAGRVAVCRGGRRLAGTHHHLEEAGLSDEAWRRHWEASRWFITADGEADKSLGNETIRWHPEQGWIEIKLPRPLAHLANARHGRWRLSAPVSFPYRGDEVAAKAASGAVRYDISFDADRRRWYLDASWRVPAGTVLPALDELRGRRVLAVDVNASHLATVVVDASGNLVGAPATLPLDLAGLEASTRDGRLRAAVSVLVRMAHRHGCRSITIEDLDFAEARAAGREYTGRRPSRGRRGRSHRRLVAGIPTAKFRDRLAQMASNAGLAVIAVDPAYTSRWGAEHWLGSIRTNSPDASGHHAAALVIGRRGLGQRARRRERCDSTRPEDRQERATDSAVRPTSAPAGLSERHSREPGDSQARGQPLARQRTRPAEPHPRATRTPKTVRGAARSADPSATS